MRQNQLIESVSRGILRLRSAILAAFVLLTVFMGYQATWLQVDAAFLKFLPVKHPYMETFLEYQSAFGGANRILISMVKEKGDIFTPEFFATLRKVTDEVFYLPGVERSSVSSLFTPNVRFVEVVEGGFSGGNVIPADFTPTPEGLQQVRQNLIKSGRVGLLVSSDFQGAMVSADLIEPEDGSRLDYGAIAKRLNSIRDAHGGKGVSIHIIGFAMLMGNIIDSLREVVWFFLSTLAMTAMLLYAYIPAIRLAALPLIGSLIAVVWQMGLLHLLGYSLDPISILVPFLVLAVGISHGVQMVNAMRTETINRNSRDASIMVLSRLLIPGSIAILSDAIGFITVLVIDIEVIREMAIAASLGIAGLLLTHLLLLPVLLSYVPTSKFRNLPAPRRRKIWHILSALATRPVATPVIVLATILLATGIYFSQDLPSGDLQQGVPELWPGSRYNQDIATITGRFAIGVDVLTVIAESEADACTNYPIMETIDSFAWQIRNTPGVHAVHSLPLRAKMVNAGWHDGSMRWRSLPRNPQVMAQAVSPFDTSSGLLNADCSVMPIYIYTQDHKASTIRRITDAVTEYSQNHPDKEVRFRLASGNVGVMAATNEAVTAARTPMLLYVYVAIAILCLAGFRSLTATICIILPLGLVSVLTTWLMSSLEIGLKVTTLPVITLGVGIGVDYGIYIYSQFSRFLKTMPLREAYRESLQTSGNAVIFTAMTLAAGVLPWMASDLKLQADMGILLAFMFLANMTLTILILPALAAWFYPKEGHLVKKPGI